MPIVFTQHQEEGTFAVTFAAGYISGTIVINQRNPINLFLPVGLPSPNPTTTGRLVLNIKELPCSPRAIFELESLLDDYVSWTLERRRSPPLHG